MSKPSGSLKAGSPCRVTGLNRNNKFVLGILSVCGPKGIPNPAACNPEKAQQGLPSQCLEGADYAYLELIDFPARDQLHLQHIPAYHLFKVTFASLCHFSLTCLNFTTAFDVFMISPEILRL